MNTLDRILTFINKYNSFGMGKADVIETKEMVVIKIWNAGFSENEYMEYDFVNLKDIKNLVVLRCHPITILAIEKIAYEILRKEPLDPFLKKIKNLKCYKKEDKFYYTLEL